MDALPPDDIPPNADPETEAGLAPELPAEPVIGPGRGRRRVRIAITLVVVVAFVVVAGLGGSGFIFPRSSGTPVTTEIPATSGSPATRDAAAAARLAVVDTNGGLSTMAADGGSVVTYSGLGATYAFPAWSPDGTRIAAIATSGDGVGIDVFTVPVAEGSVDSATIVYQSANEPPFYLYWSPDSATLAFLASQFDGLALRQVPADGSDLGLVVRKGNPMYWQWVDPTRLFVHSGAALDAYVGELDLHAVPGEPTTNQPGLFRAPALSGDGAYLAYASGTRSGAAAIVTESRDGTRHHEIPVFGSAALAFAPTGNALAFLASESPDAVVSLPVGPLRAVDAASGAIRTLLGGQVVGFFWSPDGSTIAAMRVTDAGGTRAVARGTPAGRPQSPVGVLARAAAAAPSGRAIIRAAASVPLNLVFVDAASGAVRSELTVRLSDLFLGQVLPFFDQYALSHRFWAPDSTSIALPLVDEQGVSRVTIIPADSSNPRVIAAGVMGSWSP